jgi:cell wall-associated NlpC family hydrolase
MQRLTPEQRKNIVRAAKDWLGTPYHHHARVKHAGADCAMFPLAVYQGCGVLPQGYKPPQYSAQWHLHRSEELYLKEIEKFVTEIDAAPQPADFIVFRFGRTFSHGAIVVEWPIVIHSYIPHGVLISDVLRDGELLGRERKCFEVRPMAPKEAARRLNDDSVMPTTL